MWLDKLKENWIIIASGLVIIVFFFVRNHETVESDQQLTVTENMDSSEKEEELTVATIDIKGAVENPGVYEISLDSRINDVIQLAGGFAEKADEMFVNLAQKVQDEMTIIVPLIDENNGESSAAEYNENEKVKLNYATQEEVETLNGIGPSKAMAIIQHRDEHGLFQTVEDLLEVSGIGEKTLDNLKDDIQIP